MPNSYYKSKIDGHSTWIDNTSNRRIIQVDRNKMHFARYKMEIYLNRKLNQNEDVHHIDGDTLNDDIKNLKALLHGEHTKLHRTGSKLKSETKMKINPIITNRYKTPFYS